MLEAIRNRRSIRKYLDKPVPAEKIEMLLKSAMQAPSAMNKQPWEFVVSQNREVMDHIPKIHPYAQMVASAGAVIIVCGNRDIQDEIGYIVEDCSAAIQNILIEAVNLQLGAVWLGVYPRAERMKEIASLFNLPEHIVPIGIVSIGIPGETKAFENRFNKSKIHQDTW